MTSTHLQPPSSPSSPDGPKPKKPRLDVGIVSFSAYTANAQSHHFLCSSHLAGCRVTMCTGTNSATLGGMLACPLSQTSSRYHRLGSGPISVFCDPQMERFTSERSTRRCTTGWSIVVKRRKKFPVSLLLDSLASVRFCFLE